MKRFLMAFAAVVAFGAVSGTAHAGMRCTDGKNRKIKVINDTSFTIVRLYGSNVSKNKWEEDVLGSSTVPPGGTVIVDWDDDSCYCYFDFKAVFSDDTKTIHRRFNVCTEDHWRIYE